MTLLKLQRQTLALESDLNRLALQAEFRQLRDARTWAGFMKRGGRELAPWAFALVPLFGVVAALGLRRAGRLFGSVARVINAARKGI